MCLHEIIDSKLLIIETNKNIKNIIQTVLSSQIVYKFINSTEIEREMFLII